jgi:hypothetical protein
MKHWFSDVGPFQRNQLKFFLDKAAETDAPAVRVRLGLKRLWLITEPELARTLLKGEGEVAEKGFFIRKLRPQLSNISTDSVNQSRKSLLTLLGNARLDSFYRSINKELILCQLEPNNVLTKGQILLQQVQPKNGLERFFKRLSILFNKNKGFPYEPFQGGYVLRRNVRLV